MSRFALGVELLPAVLSGAVGYEISALGYEGLYDKIKGSERQKVADRWDAAQIIQAYIGTC